MESAVVVPHLVKRMNYYYREEQLPTGLTNANGPPSTKQTSDATYYAGTMKPQMVCNVSNQNGVPPWYFYASHMLQNKCNNAIYPMLTGPKHSYVQPGTKPTPNAAHYANYPPRKPRMMCNFCRQNGDPWYFYTSHVLRDRFGNVICPILRQHHCEMCGATGSQAHTKSYCPLWRNAAASAMILKNTPRNSSGKFRFAKQPF